MINFTNTFIVNSVEALKKFLKPFDKLKSTITYTKTVAVDPVNGEITITTTGLEGPVKIVLNTRLSGNVNSVYANDLATSGKPYVFEVSNVATAVAEISSILNKLNDHSLKCEAAGETGVKFVGDNYTMFLGADVYTWDATKADWVKVTVTVTPTPCENGFGTYEQLTKDIRLFTEANTGLAPVHADEWPIMGKKYNQYTITCTTEGRKLGTGAVGAIVTSVTNHVFFIETSIATDAETEINKLLPETAVEDETEE